ncbi:MAG: branched-chain amino acid transporter permease [Pseudonocardiales bacterium]|nr:branched-chain amino acid transporter permease [Pseudonocardiales bacterium]
MTLWYDSHLVLIQATFINILFALSIQVPLRMGVFSFAGVGFYGIGSYTAAIVNIRYGWSVVLCILAGMAVAAVVGYVLALVVGRLGGLYLGMATIAFDLILTVVAINGGSLTGGALGLYGAVADVTILQLIVITLIALVIVAFSERGKLGRQIESVRDDPELASSVGVRVARMRRMSFVAGGLLGGASGAMNVLIRSTISPDSLGFSLVTLALTMIIVGGARSWLGAVIGAIIFTWLPNVLDFVSEWQAIIYGVIVALAAIYVPGGIVGVGTDLVRSREARRHRDKVAAATAAAATPEPPRPEALTLEALSEAPAAGAL